MEIAKDKTTKLPGNLLDASKMPGHWLLARLGKRVLRPGGVALTRSILDGLRIGQSDDVIEMAPGLGQTARMIVGRRPLSYTGVERDADAVSWLHRRLGKAGRRFIGAPAEDTGLEAGSASVVVTEAMLTMQPLNKKMAILEEAWRCLRPGGRLGMHELVLVPDTLPAETRQDIEGALSSTLHVGARPLTRLQWQELLDEKGFEVERVFTAPMHLLEPLRLIADEGPRALQFAWGVLRDKEARERIAAMRATFRRYPKNLEAIGLIARKR